MKAMYLCDEKECINRVYDTKTRKILSENFELSGEVFSKSELTTGNDVECIFSTWGCPSFTEEEIDRYFPSLKIIFYAAGSVRTFAEPFLKKNVLIVSSWMANAVPVAEYATAQIILANKGFYNASRIYKSKEGFKKAYEYCQTFRGTYGTNIGLLGVGAIGSMVAQRLQDYKVNIYAYDPYLSEEKADKLNIKKESLEFIFENCNTISNHIANLPVTVGLLDYNLFSRMKENAVFINTGRGAQIKEADLIRALKEKPTRTAVLDVTTEEPCDENNEFYSLDNVFLTPHIAGSLGDECQRMGEYAMEEAMRFVKNEPLRFAVTLDMLKRMA